ncbi:MAG: CCA tRNA nucleotidyltransferase [Candidatus Obscuribacterales bacterium]|nr:CCA tRNA nucleotidyltransferase [Candidatus Obscuribacterales bacterium]
MEFETRFDMENLDWTLSKSELLTQDAQKSAVTRLQEAAINPALNSAFIEPFNALASTANSASRALGGEDFLARKHELPVAQAEFLSGTWLLEGVSGGLGMLVPYTIAGKVGGGVLRKAGASLNLSGDLAKVFKHQATAQIMGAAVYDGMRETRAGETHLGNAFGGAAAFGVFELGNSASKELPLLNKVLTRAITGMAGAGTQLTVSRVWSSGHMPGRDELLKAGISGSVMNLALPEAQRFAGKAIDAGRMSLGLGVPLDRYIESRSQGKPASEISEALASSEAQLPWAKVQTGNGSNDFSLRDQKISLNRSSDGFDKLGRELSRLEQSRSGELEGGFKKAADLLSQGKAEDAFQVYRETRLGQEAQAHHLENQIAHDLGKARSVFLKAELAQEIGAWPAPGNVSQERRWRQEFSQFMATKGAFRPGQSFAGQAEFIPEQMQKHSFQESPEAAKERKIATDVVRTLQDKGHIAVFAGGSVRDEIMGRSPKDFDIATSASPDAVEKVFADQGYKVLTVGKQFGTVKAIIDGVQVEVTTLRNDGNYTDGRRPDSVEFAATLGEDAARRDLTMNAMFKDPLTDTYYDLHGGKADIEARRIRTVGEPAQRFAEDNLRMMRIPRFAARYGFSVDEAAFKAMQANSAGINKVSMERVREEMRGILEAARPSVGLDIMMDSGLMAQVIPEMIPMNGPKGMQDLRWHPEGTAWNHTKMVVDVLAANNNGENFPLMMGGLLHDIAKPLTQEIHADGGISNKMHAELGAPIAVEIAQRFKMSRNEAALIEKLVEQHMRMHKVTEMRPGRLADLLKRPEIHELIQLQHADALGRGGNGTERDSHREFLLAKMDELKNASDPNKRLDAKALVDGKMINELGFPQLPIRKEVIEAARQAQQEGVFDSSESGRLWVIANFGQHLQAKAKAANTGDNK